MRTCGQCRHARWTRACMPDERLCMIDEAHPVRVDEGRVECARYAVSAYAFLESVAHAQRRMERLAERAQRYREMAYLATGAKEAVRVSGGRGRSKVADGMDGCIDIARELDSEAAALGERYAMARAIVADIPNADAREVIEMRHFERMRWGEIARRMRYDESQVRRIDKQALAQVDKQLAQMGVSR